jgi:hypothetical protein
METAHVEMCHALAMFHWPAPPPPPVNNRRPTAATGPTNEVHTSDALPRLCHPLAKQLTEMNMHLEILMQTLQEHREASLSKKPTALAKAKTSSGIETTV